MNNSLVQISGKWLIKSEVNVLLSNGLIIWDGIALLPY